MAYCEELTKVLISASVQKLAQIVAELVVNGYAVKIQMMI